MIWLNFSSWAKRIDVKCLPATKRFSFPMCTAAASARCSHASPTGLIETLSLIDSSVFLKQKIKHAIHCSKMLMTNDLDPSLKSMSCALKCSHSSNQLSSKSTKVCVSAKPSWPTTFHCICSSKRRVTKVSIKTPSLRSSPTKCSSLSNSVNRYIKTQLPSQNQSRTSLDRLQLKDLQHQVLCKERPPKESLPFKRLLERACLDSKLPNCSKVALKASAMSLVSSTRSSKSSQKMINQWKTMLDLR